MGSRGADVSSYQEPSEWRDLHPDWVIIKASEGEHTADSQFQAHVKEAARLETLAGAYHFGWPVNDPKGDADNFVRQLGHTAGAEIRFVALDVESYPDGRNVRGMSAGEIKTWGEKWAAYTRRQLGGMKVGAYADLHHYQLGWVPAGMDFYWVAEYPGGLTYGKAEHHGWPQGVAGDVLFWQFTSSPLDLDLCVLDAVELHRWAGVPVPAPKTAPPPPRPALDTYTVVRGDTLWDIARRHHVSLADLEHVNPQIHAPNVIHVGQVVYLPHGAREVAAAHTYKVRKGDTLSGIAAAHGVSLTAMERANPQVRNPNWILVGQVLHLPART